MKEDLSRGLPGFVATAIGAIISWLPQIQTGLSIAVSVVSLAIGLVTLRTLWHRRPWKRPPK